MNKYLTEIFDDINKNDNASKHADNVALQICIACSFNPDLKFALPSGAPPYKEAPQPMGMTSINLTMETRRFQLFTNDRKDISRVRKETMFVQLLEGIHPSEAKLLIAIKDQNLESIYPRITYEWARKNFPQLVPERVEQESPNVAGESVESPQTDSSQPVKRGRGRPSKAK
jgi:hypothetical protein